MRGEIGPSEAQIHDQVLENPAREKKEKQYTRDMAYAKARGMIMPKLKELTKVEAKPQGKDMKGRPLVPHGENYQEVFTLSNQLLAIDTNAADGVVAEVLGAELDKALALRTSEGKEIEAGSTAATILDKTIEELSGLLTTLNAPN